MGRHTEPEHLSGPHGQHGVGTDPAAVHGHRARGAGHAEPCGAPVDLELEPTEGDLDRRRTLRVAQRAVGLAQGVPVGRTRPADADRGGTGATQVLDECQRAGATHAQADPRHDCPPDSVNRTRAPARSSAGGSRSRSHMATCVVPISCHPPGDSRG